MTAIRRTLALALMTHASPGQCPLPERRAEPGQRPARPAARWRAPVRAPRRARFQGQFTHQRQIEGRATSLVVQPRCVRAPDHGTAGPAGPCLSPDATRAAAATARSSPGPPAARRPAGPAPPPRLRRPGAAGRRRPRHRAAGRRRAPTASACGGIGHGVAAVPAEHAQDVQSGRDSSRAPPPTRPRDSAKSGQRSPSVRSPPSSTSSPPPSGSPSTSIVRCPLAGGGDGERAGQRGRPGAAPAADHSDGQGGPADALGDVGDPVDQPALGVGQQQHDGRRRCSTARRHTPGVVLVPPDQEHAPSARAAPRTGACRVVADQDQRGASQPPPRSGDSVMQLPASAPAAAHSAAGRRGVPRPR